MLYHLEPSVEMTGGPWYTDNELDTEFIKLLSSACLQYVKDRVSITSLFSHSHPYITSELSKAKSIEGQFPSLPTSFSHFSFAALPHSTANSSFSKQE
jgi:hypothetical protein